MSEKVANTLENFADQFVIYPSKEEGRLFTAHSIRTDQVGMSDSAEEAIFELLKNIHELLSEWNKDPLGVRLFSRAPDEVVKSFFNQDSRPVPHHIIDRAFARFKEFLRGDLSWKPYDAEPCEQDETLFQDDEPADEFFYGNIDAEDVAPFVLQAR